MANFSKLGSALRNENSYKIEEIFLWNEIIYRGIKSHNEFNPN